MTEERRRIYLDNAATSYPKPDSVYEVVDDYQRNLGGAVGRGTTQTGSLIQKNVDRARNRFARLIDLPNPENVIFTSNGTDSLNLALHGFLKQNDHVVTTCWEHNSVLRPLQFLSQQKEVSTTFVDSDDVGGIDLDSLKKAMEPQPSLVCVTHASNVTGVIQPINEIVEIAHEAGAKVLLDAAQSIGHVPVSMKETGVDFLACPGHKGLLGPLGTGLLAIRPGLKEDLLSIRQGGTGTTSELETQPDTLPEKFESGNHNAPGLFGLEAALQWLEEKTLQEVQRHEAELTRQFIDGLQSLREIECYFPEESIKRVGVVSLNATRLEPQVLASLLDEHFGIETRAGLHCSPRAHAAIGTKERGGTVRFSFGPFTTPEEIDFTLEALGQITSAF
ncbi:aminotransferase class V-fold PLP-dependent enzyme [Planctomicrobium sp.]|jgi:cysteine desulfurase / selenocysteine lyase|nr:aminotransferase class V-fold PLP-dependent enzyme [Planctomicrobium sp.]MBT5017184.1 aminotransferase class V-fold PLP-dependent enzyme [Planctomicrobium sp.]MDB4743626.1 aminotransferase class V-fold PLP-dependent enzyme [Planctomicrobium sp.]